MICNRCKVTATYVTFGYISDVELRLEFEYCNTVYSNVMVAVATGIQIQKRWGKRNI